MRALLATVALAVTAPGAAAGQPVAAAERDYCCVAAGLAVSFDAGARRISARWGTPVAGAAATEVRAGDRLGVDGVVDVSPRAVRVRVNGGNAASFGAGGLGTVLVSNAGGFVQVRFACAKRTAAPPCRTGAFWSKPAPVSADESPQQRTSPAEPSSTSHRVRIESNGTKACEDALAALSKVIAEINANTAAAKEAYARKQDTRPFVREQSRLTALFKTLYARAKKACAPSP